MHAVLYTCVSYAHDFLNRYTESPAIIVSFHYLILLPLSSWIELRIYFGEWQSNSWIFEWSRHFYNTGKKKTARIQNYFPSSMGMLVDFSIWHHLPSTELLRKKNTISLKWKVNLHYLFQSVIFWKTARVHVTSCTVHWMRKSLSQHIRVLRRKMSISIAGIARYWLYVIARILGSMENVCCTEIKQNPRRLKP